MHLKGISKIDAACSFDMT